MKRRIKPIRVEGNLAYVPLTQGYEAVIDASDVGMIEHLTWHAFVRNHTVYARATDRTGPKRRNVLMHRLITGEPIGMEIDHIDCNGLNNQQANLRIVSASQNQQNQRVSRVNTSGYKGVSYHSLRNKWQAQIAANGTRKFLGYYSTPDAAHEAYCAASRVLHGEFSRFS